jgi:hypothetical protein
VTVCFVGITMTVPHECSAYRSSYPEHPGWEAVIHRETVSRDVQPLNQCDNARGMAPRDVPATTSEHPLHIVAASGLGDDTDRWRTGCGDWTALDERQLIRLLTDSAP